MSSTAWLIDPPPCPNCGAAVERLVTEDTPVGLYEGPDSFTHAVGRERGYTLQPCSHHVAGFTYVVETDRVAKWKPWT